MKKILKLLLVFALTISIFPQVQNANADELDHNSSELQRPNNFDVSTDSIDTLVGLQTSNLYLTFYDDETTSFYYPGPDLNELHYSISDPSVLKINDIVFGGWFESLYIVNVEGLKPGTSTITFSYLGKELDVTYQVSELDHMGFRNYYGPDPLTSISLTSDSSCRLPNLDTDIIFYDTDGNELDSNQWRYKNLFTFESTDPAIVSIEDDVIVAHKNGNAKIVLHFLDKTGTLEVEVSDGLYKEIFFNDNSKTIQIVNGFSETINLCCIPKDGSNFGGLSDYYDSLSIDDTSIAELQKISEYNIEVLGKKLGKTVLRANYVDPKYPDVTYKASIEIEVKDEIEVPDYYRLTSDGTLTIFREESYLSGPYNEKIKSIVLTDSVKKVVGLGSTHIDTIDIPNSVVEIGYNAFSGCDNLEALVIPASVQVVGPQVVFGSSVKTVKFMGDAPKFKYFEFGDNFIIANPVFDGATVTVYYPKNAKGWDEFIDGQKNDSLHPDTTTIWIPYEEKELVTDKFNDIPEYEWYVDFIQYVVDKGLMSGYTETTNFGPEDTVTRAQMVQVLYNMAGKPAVTSYVATAKFSDVYSGAWYEDAVNWAYNNGITVGMGDVFGSDTALTRAQMVTFFRNYAKFTGKAVNESIDITKYVDYKDVEEWAKPNMAWAVAIDLISGSDVNGTKYLQPLGNATRAQLATVLTKYCNYYQI